MLSQNLWNINTDSAEKEYCYKSNEQFIEFIGGEIPKSIEYGLLFSNLAEYNANLTQPDNRFASSQLLLSSNLDFDKNFYECDWKTFQIIMARQPLVDIGLGFIRTTLLRKMYSRLSDKYKIRAKKVYGMLAIRERQPPCYCAIIVNFQQFADS